MALPTDWTNQSPTTDTHPEDHNAANTETNRLGPALDGFKTAHIDPRWNVDVYGDLDVPDRPSWGTDSGVVAPALTDTRVWQIKHGTLRYWLEFTISGAPTFSGDQYRLAHRIQMPDADIQRYAVVGRWYGQMFPTPIRTGWMLYWDETQVIPTTATGQIISGTRQAASGDVLRAMLTFTSTGLDPDPI